MIKYLKRLHTELQYIGRKLWCVSDIISYQKCHFGNLAILPKRHFWIPAPNYKFLSAISLRRTSKDLNFLPSFLLHWDKIFTKIKILTNQHKQSIPPKEFLSKNPPIKFLPKNPPKKFLPKNSSQKISPKKF